MLKQRRLVLEPYNGRLNMRRTFHEGERLTFGNCNDRGLGFERLQREKRSESIMEGDISSGVEQLSLQSIDGFFRRSHRSLRLPRQEKD